MHVWAALSALTEMTTALSLASFMLERERVRWESVGIGREESHNNQAWNFLEDAEMAKCSNNQNSYHPAHHDRDCHEGASSNVIHQTSASTCVRRAKVWHVFIGGSFSVRSTVQKVYTSLLQCAYI